MKLFTTLFLSLLGISSSFAETLPQGSYTVVSDKFSEAVPAGTCIIQGTAYDQLTELGISGGVVGETSRTRYILTDAEGKFKLKLSAKDSSFYFFHQNYEEIVCWDYEFKSQHIITINFMAQKRTPEDIYPMAEKPVIYLYSDAEIAANISLQPKGEFLFTYPTYENGWNVNVSSKGLEVDNVQYPYLFWDGTSKDLSFNTTAGELSGYFIKTDSTIQFLEATLEKLGFNSTERTDFITYWGPRLTAHNYATVQFFVGEKYANSVAAINVSPKPDAQLRVYMIFQGTELSASPFRLSTPELPKFERKGFTLIEWGGSEFKPVQNKAIFAQVTY
ncbi:MAG: hypothetical protein GQ574_25115 [Crocinitomix sp.]|nr:hypothetical protein [Crocinitomix sp.]